MTLCSCGPHPEPATEPFRAHAPPRPFRRPGTPQPRSRRFSVPLRLEVTVAGAAPLVDRGARIGNLSHTGALIRSLAPLRPGRAILLRFHCGTSVCVASGVVLAARRRGVALRFDGRNGAFDTLLGELDGVREGVSRDVLGAISRVTLLAL
jgi:hypothetical protein